MTTTDMWTLIGLLIAQDVLALLMFAAICFVADRLNAVLGDGNARYLFLRRRYKRNEKPKGYGG